MEESRFNALVDDFKDWCDKNGVEYTEISGTYYNIQTEEAKAILMNGA